MRRALLLMVLALLVAGCKKQPAQPPADLAVVYQVGVFANADNAYNLRETLVKMNYDVSVEKFAEGGAAYHRVMVRHDGPLEFVYQVGAFTDRDNAERLKASLVEKGWPADIRKVTINDAVYWRVYVRNRDSQEQFARRMKDMGLGEPVFRSLKTL